MSLKPIVELLQTLSFSKIAQVFVLTLILVLAWFSWSYRTTLYSNARVTAISDVNEPIIIETSLKSQKYIENILARSKDTIAGIQILNVNFTQNSRTTSYFGITDEKLKNAVDYYLARKVSSTPLFNSDVENNKRVVELINGNFICYNFNDTFAAIAYSGARGHISVICSTSIPPYYGQFSGYLNIYLKKPVSVAEVEFMKQLSKEISLMIYENDIIKTPPMTPSRHK